MKKSFFILLLTVLLLPISVARAQLSVAPTPIYIDDRTNAASFFVSNRSDTPQEISIELLFGFVVSDSTGNRTVTYEVPEGTTDFDVTDMVRVFPRAFILGGNQQRTVRVQVVPRADMPEGTYFARLRVVSQAAAEDLEALAASLEEGDIATRIAYRFEQGFALFYQRGTLNTSVEIAGHTVEVNDENVRVLTKLQRTGNSPYQGTITGTLRNGDGEVVQTVQSATVVYFDMVQPLTFNRANLPSGNYILDLDMETSRIDINPAFVVNSDRINRTLEVQIP